ncbi:hypothetical protein D3C87_392600 [compost metagenome]
MINPAARLEWKSFFVAGKALAKRLGTEDGKAAIKIMVNRFRRMSNICPNNNPQKIRLKNSTGFVF